MSGRLKRSPWIIVLALGIAIAWAAFLVAQLDQLRSLQWQLNPAALSIAIVCGACYFASLACCWALLLHQQASQTERAKLAWLWAAVQVWLRSMSTRYIPGNIWHILSRVTMAGDLGVTRSQVVSSATIEQLLTLLGALSLFGLSLPFWQVEEQRYNWLLVLIPIGLLALHPRCLGRLLAWLARRFRRPELAWNYPYRNMLVLTALYSIANGWAGVGLVVLLGTMYPPTLDHSMLVIGSAGLAWAVGYLSVITPSGLGVREGVLTLMLSQIAPLPIAIASALLYRLTLSLGELCITLIAWIYRLWRNDTPYANNSL
jgi:glycosyltransferase 2 family protein